MYSRIVNCTVDPAKVGEFKAALNNEFLPRIHAQPGFIDNIESLDPATGQFSCMTLWESAADVGNYDKRLFQAVAAKRGPVMQVALTVQTQPVENRSVHHVLAGE